MRIPRLRALVAGRGLRAGQRVVAAPVQLTYRFAGSKVAEAWTCRHNYVFFFGETIRHPLGFILLLIRILIWNWRWHLGRRFSTVRAI